MNNYLKCPQGYYVYAFMRSQSSINGKQGTPYYIGKGKRYRAWDKRRCIKPPLDESYIIIIAKNLTEVGAFAIERQLIRWYGRIDQGTGILRNLTDGGEGSSGRIMPISQRIAYSVARKGIPKSEEHRQAMRGRRHSPESKAKISEKGRNRGPVSADTGQKISAALTGKKHSLDTIIKIREAALKRPPRSAETRAKISQNALERSRLRLLLN